MKEFRLLILTFCVALSLYSCSIETNNVFSPNGKIIVNVESKNRDADGYGPIYCTVEYVKDGMLKTVFSQIDLGLTTERQDLASKLKLVTASSPKEIKEDYTMLTGKRSHCSNQGTERIFRFKNKEEQILDVVFRVYDDGVAFNYSIESIENEKENIVEELTSYLIPEGVKRWMHQYTVDYENFYPLATNGESEDKNAYMWGYPALVEPEDSLFVLITEADLKRGHSTSRLYNVKDKNLYQVRTTDEKVEFQGEWRSPWRLLIVGDLADIVESTLVTDVSAPSTVSNTDWIVPGKAAWIYWAHNHGSRDFRIVKEYIDLAAEMGWTYNLIDAEWDVMGNGGTIETAIDYSLQRKVKVLLWYNSGTNWIGPGAPGPIGRLNTKEDREAEYAKLAEMGVSGIKIDFFAEDGVDMINYYIDLLEDAVEPQLMINFHGATIPRGWQRTYPHMVTVEAVYGAEWYNNRPFLTDRAATHNATLPFTRNVIGPMDYTPGTFSDSQHPHITSHGHELALYVLFESALQHMPDRPSSYRSLPDPVKEFLRELPTVWDDTRLLGGYPGKEAIIARRKGDQWFIGGINGTDNSQVLSFTLNTLNPAGKKITLFKDGEDNRSFSIEKDIPLSEMKDVIEVDCLPRGGFVAVIK